MWETQYEGISMKTTARATRDPSQRPKLSLDEHEKVMKG